MIKALNSSNIVTQAKIASLSNYLHLFIFFLVFPALNILGSSITFYLFIIIIYKLGTSFVTSRNHGIIFLSFLFMIFLSTILGPYDLMKRHPGVSSIFQILIQYVYWIFLALFFKYYFNYIDFLKLSRLFFWGFIAATIGFYLIPLELNLKVITINFYQTRNAYVFTFLSSVPIAYYYITKTFTKGRVIFSFFILLLVMLLTNGRSGAIIGTLELILISGIIFKPIREFSKMAIIPMLFLFYVSQNEDFKPILDGIANKVESLNPRFASLLKGEGEGDLDEDKSWLHRKLMIDKGYEIIEDYPLIGIGASNFRYFDSRLETLNEYRRLMGKTEEYYNMRSSHNSYIQLLAEFGIIGFSIFMLILLIPLVQFINFFVFGSLELKALPLLSVFGITIHFYTISAITGALPWVVIGLSYGYLSRNKK